MRKTVATKTPYYNHDLPTLRFPWALKVSDFSERLLVSGHADVKHDNRTANFPEDLIAQTKFILDQISKSVEAAGFTLHDAIRTETTLSKDVTDDQLPELFEVLKAYREAQDAVSVNRLCAYLKQIHYTYPYHQAIGFYLERAGNYTASQIELLRQFPVHFDFYLANNMAEPDFDERWRLFIPKMS